MAQHQVEFKDGTEGHVFGGKYEDPYSIRWVAMGHVKKMLEYGSKEWMGGYWQTRSHKSGDGAVRIEKFYVPDSREEFCNAVSIFLDFVYPLLDDEEKAKTDKILAEVEDERKKVLEKTSIEDEDVLSNDSYKDQDKFIIENYRFKKLKLHRKLARELFIFLERIDYFGGEIGITD